MPDIRHELKIDALPERVFAALSTEKGFRGWWTRDVKFEPRVGRVAEFGFYPTRRDLPHEDHRH